MPGGTLAPEIRAAVIPFRRALRRASDVVRRDLPWVGLDDPWAIFVSEVMLQQTSTARVLGPWRRFVATYPTPASCAHAPLADVLRLWQGLGYPRRAKSLHDASRIMVERFAGGVPSSPGDLLTLPGIGPYSANAVASFAYRRRVAVLDTNVGRVLARALANRPLRAREAQHLADTLLARDARIFNQAMLDLGAQFCTKTPRCAPCPVRRQCRWWREGGDDPAPQSAAVTRPQARFVGSDRQVRGRLLRALGGGAMSRRALRDELRDVARPRLDRALERLSEEGLVAVHGERVALTGDVVRAQ